MVKVSDLTSGRSRGCGCERARDRRRLEGRARMREEERGQRKKKKEVSVWLRKAAVEALEGYIGESFAYMNRSEAVSEWLRSYLEKGSVSRGEYRGGATRGERWNPAVGPQMMYCKTFCIEENLIEALKRRRKSISGVIRYLIYEELRLPRYDVKM